MTIKITLFLIIVFLQSTFSFSQVDKKVVGYIDNDNLPDTLFYKDLRFKAEFQEKDIAYSCKIVRGNGKKYEFNLPLGYESVQISSPKKGFLEIYQWKTGMQGFEQYQTFKFNSEYEILMLQKSVTTNSDGKEETFVPKKMTGIDGTEYKNEKLNISGLYSLKNDSKRFSIQIKEKEGDYIFTVFDKNKKISSGNVRVEKVNGKDFIFLNDMEAEYKTCSLIVKNRLNNSSLKKHFVQYKDEKLIFKKDK